MSKPLPSLLLLPPPPTPISSASFSAAYRPSIAAAVSALRDLPASTELFLVIPCPGIHGRLNGPRSLIYAHVQELLGRLYSLVCIVCAQLGVDVESDIPGSIDARVLLLDYDSSHSSSNESDWTLDQIVCGPIIDLPTLSITRRRWNLIFSVDGEEAKKILARYTTLANRTSPPVYGHVRIIEGGVSMVQQQTGTVRLLHDSSAVHNVVAVGGTFDHLHAGHKLLLTATALLLQPTNKTSTNSRRLIVGITGDALLKNKKYGEYLKIWKQRQEDVVDFLLSILSFSRSSAEEAVETLSFDDPVFNGRAIHTKLNSCSITIECVEIQDPFGPTVTDENITALVVSGETRSGGQAVNEKRLDKGWKALEVFEIDVLDSQENRDNADIVEEFASKISSTAIRKRKAENARTSSL